MRTGVVVTLCILLFLLGMVAGTVGTVAFLAWRDHGFGHAREELLMERARAEAMRQAAEQVQRQEALARRQAEEARRRAEEALEKIRKAEPAKD